MANTPMFSTDPFTGKTYYHGFNPMTAPEFFEEYVVLIDHGNGEVTHLVEGLEAAELLAELAVYRDGALYSAVLDRDYNTICEYES